MNGRIELGGAHMSDAVLAAVAEVLRSGWLGQGPRVEAFERAFGEFCGGAHPVAVSSGTAALHLAVRLLDLPPGAEVVTTPITFIATNQVLLYENLVPVFADVEPRTGNVSVESMAERIGPRTGALMVTHYAGYPCDLDALYTLAHSRGLQVIEDCAHAAGARYRGRRIGSHEGLQAFSFQATKNLSAVDGGLLFARTETEAERARRLRWMGIDSSTYARTGAGGERPNVYAIPEPGYRYAMSDLNAAIALVQLEHLDPGNVRRAQLAARYAAGLAGVGSVQCLRYAPDRESSYHLYPVLSPRRDALAAHLRARGVVTGTHYSRCDRYPMFEAADLPAAEAYADAVLTLPMHLGLRDEDVDQVIDAVRAFG